MGGASPCHSHVNVLVELLLGFWCSLHVLSVLVPTSPVSAVFSSTPSLIGFH